MNVNLLSVLTFLCMAISLHAGQPMSVQPQSLEKAVHFTSIHETRHTIQPGAFVFLGLLGTAIGYLGLIFLLGGASIPAGISVVIGVLFFVFAAFVWYLAFDALLGNPWRRLRKHRKNQQYQEK